MTADNLMGLGFVVMGVAQLWMLVNAFRTGLWWGLGCLLLPFVSLLFVLLHWKMGSRPLLLLLVGAAMVFGGARLSTPNYEPEWEQTT
jgi:hypothetical protein